MPVPTGRVFVAGFVVFLSFITYNEIMHTHGHNAEADMGAKSMPAKHFSGPAIKFLYCYSCGYRKLFEDFSNMIHQNFPEIEVHGDNYPPPPLKQYLSSALSMFKMAFILCVVSGYNVFELLGMPTPQFMTWAWENKLYASMMAFFIGNAIEGHLIATGAFEISFNGVEVWSKLRSGRPPSANELFEILQSQSSSSFAAGGGGPSKMSSSSSPTSAGKMPPLSS